VHHVDDAFEVLFFADRKSERNDCALENVVRAIERDADIRMLFINLVTTIMRGSMNSFA
jgi:hypothetical protein